MFYQEENIHNCILFYKEENIHNGEIKVNQSEPYIDDVNYTWCHLLCMSTEGWHVATCQRPKKHHTGVAFAGEEPSI